MKDIDFDELDKAVSSLMGSVEQPKDDVAPTPASFPKNPVIAAPAVAPEVVAPMAQTQASVPVASPSEPVAVTVTPAAERAAPPAMRRSGRFMDMVSKPSDAKRPAQVAPTPSREGLSITPRTDEDTATPVQSTEPESSAAVAFEAMPDPIDMSQNTQPVVSETGAVVEEIPQSAPESIESPFLADAKVEKRPLNAGMPEQSPLSELDVANALQLEDPDTPDDRPAEQDALGSGEDEPPAIPRAPELSSDLVAIESTEHTEVTQAVETKDAAADVAEPSTPLGASSIAQQYKSQPSTGDQSHAAIYDASQYPEPVSHPAKGKAGWLWVLWVVLLLGVGAGGAIVLYNLGIIP